VVAGQGRDEGEMVFRDRQALRSCCGAPAAERSLGRVRRCRAS
jgi:hypothetical protein